MLKWKVLGGAVAVLTVGVTAIALLPATGQTGGTKLVLCEKNGNKDYEFDVDNPPKHFSAGDQFIFSEPEFNKSKRKVGKIVGTAQVIRLKGDNDALSQFNVSFSLEGGRIEVQAATTFGNINDAQLALIGGTGKYTGVTGTVHPRNRPCDGFEKGDSTVFKFD